MHVFGILVTYMAIRRLWKISKKHNMHPGILHDVPCAKTWDISPLKEVSTSIFVELFHWVDLYIKQEVCIEVKLIAMLIYKVFSWNTLELKSVYILGTRCSHCRVIIILWLFGKTVMASGTFIYMHGITGKQVCWHSKWKTKAENMLAARKKEKKKRSISKTENFSDSNGLLHLSHWQHLVKCLTLSVFCFRSIDGEEPRDWEI